MRDSIRVAIAGVGNCASSLVQLVQKAKTATDIAGLMHLDIDGYGAEAIQFVAAFDVNRKKIGQDLGEAIQTEPNCTTLYVEVPRLGVQVSAGSLTDGIGSNLEGIVDIDPVCREITQAAIVAELRTARVDVLVNYLPVGSPQDTRTYALAAAEAGCGFVNCNPELVAHDAEVVAQFERAGVPLLGDDIKSQLGATLLHRALCEKLKERGAVINKSYQLNVGGNTDFLNMTDRARSASKKRTKTDSVREVLGSGGELSVGPSDYVPLLKDRKVAYIRIEGTSCLGMSFSLESRLEVEDSPNSAGVAVDAIRCAKVAMDRGIKGIVSEPSCYFFKHPPRSVPEKDSRAVIDAWIRGTDRAQT